MVIKGKDFSQSRLHAGHVYLSSGQQVSRSSRTIETSDIIKRCLLMTGGRQQDKDLMVKLKKV
jgi:hypothetical protein